MKEFPLVSIIAVCHNHAPYVIETLESIRKQTYKNIELIIINNLQDNCKNIIENWIREFNVQCKFIQNEQPFSIAVNLNLGLSFTKGKYFQGIACDDILLPQKIEKQVELFENLDESYACVYSDLIFMDESGLINEKETLQEKKQKKWGTNLFPSGNLKNELSLLSFIPAPSVLLKTEIINKLNGYDEKYLFEDWPLWIKLCKNNYQFKGINEPLGNYRLVNGSLGSDLKNYAALDSLIDFYTDNINFFDFRVRNTFLNFKTVLTFAEFKFKNLFLFIRVILKSRKLSYTKYLLKYILR